MGNPLVEEFCRVSGEFAPSFLRRCQRVFRDEVQSQLDERDRLLVEVEDLRSQVTALKAEKAERKATKEHAVAR